MQSIPKPDTSGPAERKVGMGGIDVLKGTGILRTLLGSCIGLVLQDSRNAVGGLAHIVLPVSNGSDHLPGRYADTAIPELIRLIEQAGGRSRSLVAKFAGGSNMFASSTQNRIGDQNVQMVEQLLKQQGIPVVARDCGGQQGRRVAYDVQSGIVTVELMGSAPIQL